MLKMFRVISMVEGLSLIVLLCIAMPAKYQFGIDLVKTVGPIHGFLWLAYLPMLEITSRQQGWSKSFWNLAFITSIVPFGCFFLENKMKENTRINQA